MFRKGFLTSTSWTVNGDGFAVGNNAEGADFLAKILYTCLGDGAAGVTTTGFQVVKKTGLTCTVKPFFVAKSGYFAWDTAETDITFTSSASERVIYVGVRLDLPNDTFVGGVAGRTTFVAGTDLVAAKITIPANAVTLTDGMIEDLRYNTTYCGQIDEYRERSIELIANAEEELAALQAAAAEVTVETIGAMPKEAISSNLLINGNFNVNQRAKSGTVTLAAGAYGHDRWKAGASGCTYTFATSNNITTLTISAGSLIQVVEGLNLQSGTVCLSWTGTARGKIGAGSYSASGVTGTATGGANLNIEFNTGTLSKVQLNYGSVALPFVPRSFADELRLCQRYYEKSYEYATAPGTANTLNGLHFTWVFNAASVNGARWILGSHPQFKVDKRIAPTITLYTYSGSAGQWEAPAGTLRNSGSIPTIKGLVVTNNTGGSVTPTAGEAYGHWVADAEL